MTEYIDVRGLPCPQPVLRSRKAMENSTKVSILISDKVQVANVSRMAERSGWSVSSQPDGDHFVVSLRKETASGQVDLKPEDLVCSTDSNDVTKSTVLVITG
ncbi:sulfurtransferase TusA family protein, partial [bacterium]|nr:sulfurtransferase TusA family protein [candidate division CSSED10-310 bacterium]